MSNSEQKKIVIIGDGYVGKTSILHAIKDVNFAEQAPNVQEEFTISKSFNGKTIVLHFVDTPGQEEYDAIRKLMYSNVDIFLICFSIGDPISLENVKMKWIHDIAEYNKIPKILVGTKVDLRKGTEYVRKEDAKIYQKRIRAVGYVECSSKTREGIEDLLQNILLTALGSDSKRSCLLQ